MKNIIKYTGATIALLGLTSLSAVADHHGNKKAKVVKTDLVGKNGVIHVIDSVIMPK